MRAPGSSRPRLRITPIWRIASGLLLAATLGADEGGELGLPFTRFYPYEEIGNAARGMRLGFDPLGRITMSRDGACIALNDTAWIDLADREGRGKVMQRLVFAPDGDAYFSAFGLWGRARMQGGRLEPVIDLPADRPRWTRQTNFNDIVATADGAWFAGFNGIVHWDRRAGRHTYYEVNGISRIFLLGDRTYYSSSTDGIGVLDPETRTVRPLRPPLSAGIEIDQVTAYDETRVLTADTAGRLRFFDGREFSPFPGPLGERARGRVIALTRLPEGNVAVAVNGAGLYLAAPSGQVVSALTSPDYHRVTDLAAREPGVLWIVNENGIEKILYRTPLTSFGQRQGLPLSWPQVERWNGRLVVASGGQLYIGLPGPPGEATRFEPMQEQPAPGVWAIATSGDELLIATKQTLYARRPGGDFEPVLNGIDIARLVQVDGVVYALGNAEIAALRRVDGRWTECAPRIAGLGYPMIAHGTNHAAWMELGPQRTARVQLRDGRLNVRVFEDFPWQESRWVNIGWAGDIVAFTNLPHGRVYFDERTETFVERPELAQLLDQTPFTIIRFRQDAEGTIWAAYDDGLLTIRGTAAAPVIDATTYGRINDRYPLVRLLPDGDIWLLTGQSLHHVNRHFETLPRPAFQPILVSLAHGRTNRELLPAPGAPVTPASFPYEDNNLLFRFFAGSYAFRHPPAYDFILHRDEGSRPVVGNGPLLTLGALPEGRYRLEVRLTDARKPVGAPLMIAFAIAPPWYRSAPAYGLYVLGAAVFLIVLLRWSTSRSRRENLALEKLVAERTEELRAAMRKLNEETRNAATLAERDRLAGEIHDSLQQGLSGLMLQLDATLKLPDLTDDVRSRLLVARNMVSFTRHEVQHAVWDMETPLLEGTELGEALGKLTTLIGPGAATVRVETTGQPCEISPAVKHHLLRIAQEAITNAVRHAAAQHITLSLTYTDGGVCLEAKDDGNGFVPGRILTDGIGHFGLRGLRGRAGKIGGDLQIISAPGQGTTVRVTVQTSPTVI